MGEYLKWSLILIPASLSFLQRGGGRISRAYSDLAGECFNETADKQTEINCFKENKSVEVFAEPDFCCGFCGHGEGKNSYSAQMMDFFKEEKEEKTNTNP